jgi:predicted GH43/DUF377 family glycosyl hydrolase
MTSRGTQTVAGLAMLVLGLGASLSCDSSSSDAGSGVGGNGGAAGAAGRGGAGGSATGGASGGAASAGAGGAAGGVGGSGGSGAAGGSGGQAGAGGSATAGQSGAGGAAGSGGATGAGGSAGRGGGAGGNAGRGGSGGGTGGTAGGFAGTGGRGGGGNAGTGAGGRGGSGGGGAGATGTGGGGTGGAAGTTCPANPPAGLPSGPLTRYAGNPIVRNGPGAIDFQKAGPRAVLKEGPTTYRMWYEAVGSAGITVIGYASSTDGLTWTKQGAALLPGGSASWERDEVSPNFILLEGGVYKLWYHGGGYFMGGSGTRYGTTRVGYATSSDGLTWTKHPSNPVLDVGAAGAFDDEQVAEPRVTRLGSGYRMYYTGANASSRRKSLGMATSADGVTWTKDARNPILDSNRWGNFWGGAFFYQSGVWLLWHGSDTTSSGRINFKWSLDGVTWTDGAANPVLLPGSATDGPDTRFVGDSVSGYRDGSSYRIMYTGYAENLFGSEGRFEGICMASVMAICP